MLNLAIIHYLTTKLLPDSSIFTSERQILAIKFLRHIVSKICEHAAHSILYIPCLSHVYPMQSMYINSIFSKKNHVFLENIYSILFILWKVIGNVVVRGDWKRPLEKWWGRGTKIFIQRTTKKNSCKDWKQGKLPFKIHGYVVIMKKIFLETAIANYFLFLK